LGKNNRACAKRAKEILGSLGARLLGVVVNGISNRGKHKQYGYAHYAQSQAYGYAEYYRS
jgi:Mrp family chromosome partitioning ATPase